MKVPWKYRKVADHEFDRIDRNFKIKAEYYTRPANYYDNCRGSKWYRTRMQLVRDLLSVPKHWTRDKTCSSLVPGVDIVDCLCGIRNGRGRLSWMVGQHYVGMCPFKDKWKLKLKLKGMFGNKGRE